MSLDEAVIILRNAVKPAGTIDQKHIDLTLIPVRDREKYEKALIVSQLAVRNGALTKEELFARLLLS